MNFIDLEALAGVWPISLQFDADGHTVRRCVSPDSDISDLPAKAQDRIRAHWATMDLADWEAIVRPPAPPVTPDMIRSEAARRIDAIVSTDDKINLLVELNDLRDKKDAGTLTQNDRDRIQTIKTIWGLVKAIRVRSAELEVTLPADFTVDANWP